MGDETNVAAIGRVQTTSVENNPGAETTTVNAYQPQEVNEMNLATPAIEPTETHSAPENVSWEEFNDMETDTAYQAKLETEGTTTTQKVNEVNKELPKGVTTKDTAKRGLTVKDLDRDMKRIKERGIKGGQEWNTPFSLKSLSWMQKAGKLVNPDGYKGLLDKSKAFGLDFGDGLTEASFSLALIEGALEASSKNDVFEKYIAGTPLEKLFKDFLVKEGIELAAKWGSYTSVKSICQNYTISKKTRKKCIELLFKGFRIKDEDLSDGMYKSARNVVSHFDYIYPSWEKYIINESTFHLTHKDHAPILHGNKDLLTLLTYYTATDYTDHLGAIPIDQDGVDSRQINIACSMQLALKIKKESKDKLFKKALPTMET